MPSTDEIKTLTPERLAEIRELANEAILDLVEPEEMYELLRVYEAWLDEPR